jgi:hypothetical protein
MIARDIRTYGCIRKRPDCRTSGLPDFRTGAMKP